MRVQYQYKVGKIGLDSHAGWVATVNGASGTVLVQRFAFEPKQEYPDGSSVEFWLNGIGTIHAYHRDMIMAANAAENPYVFESEVLSPFARLQPGQSYSWRYDWWLCNVGGDYPVVACSDTGVVAEPLVARTAADKLHLQGRFGVFVPGTVQVLVLDARGRPRRTLDLPLAVSPLQPVILDTMIDLPARAASVSIRIQGERKRPSGELATALIRSP